MSKGASPGVLFVKDLDGHQAHNSYLFNQGSFDIQRGFDEMK